VIVAVAGAELLHWRDSKSAPAMDAAPSRSCGIVVLGFPSRQNGRLHPIQRWRTEIGARSLASADRGFLVFTGGPSRGKISEAETMAAYAARLRVPAERIGLETRSRSTRENMSFALPMLESYDSIAIASDPMHAARARRYALQQRPDLSARLVFAENYRFMERWWLKVPTAAYELYLAVRHRSVKTGRLRWPRRKGFGADLNQRVAQAGGVVGEHPLEEQNQPPYK
jgi:uncharacterized SAM-binding protein YcdF (DUF218 family)